MHPGGAGTDYSVAEIPGLYGAFTFTEKLLQKLWLRGDFERHALRTEDGRRLELRHPGRWNLLGGPDFTCARGRFDDGPETTFDVELHLRAADWEAHGHARDPSYDGVGLHVVLFPPAGRVTSTGAGGRAIPILTLLPRLHRSLEEYAADDAVETLADRAAVRLPDELGRLPEAELQELLRAKGAERWRQKVHFARRRIERLGWNEACHQTALEIMGYRFNRVPMLRLAGAVPLARWQEGRVDIEALLEAERDAWSLQGVRPANRPRERLRQYAAWTAAVPEWPARLAELAAAEAAAGGATEDTRAFRLRMGMTGLRRHLAENVCGGAVGGTRLDTLVCDGFRPLAAVHGGGGGGEVWYHWFPGDLPAAISSGLRQLGFLDGRKRPACHGVAQGLLQWMLDRDAELRRTSGAGAAAEGSGA